MATLFSVFRAKPSVTPMTREERRAFLLDICLRRLRSGASMRDLEMDPALYAFVTYNRAQVEQACLLLMVLKSVDPHVTSDIDSMLLQSCE